jgi:hypothetical protein
MKVDKSNVLTVRVPAELKAKITSLAQAQGVSANQFALYLLAKGVVSLEYEQLLAHRLGGTTEAEVLAEFGALLGQIPAMAETETPAWDVMPR